MKVPEWAKPGVVVLHFNGGLYRIEKMDVRDNSKGREGVRMVLYSSLKDGSWESLEQAEFFGKAKDGSGKDVQRFVPRPCRRKSDSPDGTVSPYGVDEPSRPSRPSKSEQPLGGRFKSNEEKW